MKKTLVIGSTVVDVIITLEDYLPKTQGDVHVLNQEMSLGGCAYNTSDMIRHFGVPYILFSPVGTGAYGDFVRTNLAQRKITTPIPTPDEDNGCCYCFIEKTGERTFISYHGAEYRFQAEWFDLLNPDEIDSVYICGFEIEEKTGINKTKVWNSLYNFQHDAVVGAIKKLELYNGCIIADSVGLGKTFEANGYVRDKQLDSVAESIYSIRRSHAYREQSMGKIKKIFPIHGECMAPKTIMIGYDHYCGSLGKLDDYFKGKYLVVINKAPTPRDQYADLLIADPIGEVLGSLKI